MGAPYGLGRLRVDDYPETSESVFKLQVTGDGEWKLTHANVALMRVEFGTPKLPNQQLQPERFDDICSRIFGEYDREPLWNLAEAAQQAEHGTQPAAGRPAVEVISVHLALSTAGSAARVSGSARGCQGSRGDVGPHFGSGLRVIKGWADRGVAQRGVAGDDDAGAGGETAADRVPGEPVSDFLGVW